MLHLIVHRVLLFLVSLFASEKLWSVGQVVLLCLLCLPCASLVQSIDYFSFGVRPVNGAGLRNLLFHGSGIQWKKDISFLFRKLILLSKRCFLRRDFQAVSLRHPKWRVNLQQLMDAGKEGFVGLICESLFVVPSFNELFFESLKDHYCIIHLFFAIGILALKSSPFVGNEVV